MADTALTLEDVGHVLVYVAPGFFARAAYCVRYPRRARSDFTVLVLSVALSVPLVALADSVAGWLAINSDPTALGYVALLIALSIACGYGFALVRGWDRTRAALSRIRLGQEPEADTATRVLSRLPNPTLVTVTLKDGRIVAGSPRFGTADPDASRRELFLTFPRWWDAETASWRPTHGEGGVLLSFDDLYSIELMHDPQ